MILHASTKMDIGYYLDWLKIRLENGYFDKEINPKTVYRYKLENIEKVILYTKNPSKIYKERDFFKNYNTDLITFVTMYDGFLEPSIKDKLKIIDTIKKCKNYFNNYLGYSPIFYSNSCNKEWHLTQFDFLCGCLCKFIKGVYIDFNINTYCQKNEKINAIKLSNDEQKDILTELENIAKKYELKVFLIKQESSFSPNEIDIGLSNCCPATCEYCQHINNKKIAKQKYQVFDKNNSLLYGIISKNQKVVNIDAVKEEKIENNQTNLFDFLNNYS